MNTKLVYVLTCAPEANYIEQALMSVWSARHWNADAHIVLITDNLTDQLFVGKRAEILDYISEKIVVPFEDDGLSMMYRSRWIKTSVRQLITGDFLFIDCDTIICKSLKDIDYVDAEVGMVLDQHLRVGDYPEDHQKYVKSVTGPLGYDVVEEDYYFNSGVIYSKDTQSSHLLWKFWHENWLKSINLNILIDQPALGLANKQANHIIEKLRDEWNCLVFMRPAFIHDAYIVHFWAFENKSLMFTKDYLNYVKRNGLDAYVKYSVLHSAQSLLPFDNMLSTMSIVDYIKWCFTMAQSCKLYATKVCDELCAIPWVKSLNKCERMCFKHKCFNLISFLYVIRQYHIHKIKGMSNYSIVSFPI